MDILRTLLKAVMAKPADEIEQVIHLLGEELAEAYATEASAGDVNDKQARTNFSKLVENFKAMSSEDQEKIRREAIQHKANALKAEIDRLAKLKKEADAADFPDWMK